MLDVRDKSGNIHASGLENHDIAIAVTRAVSDHLKLEWSELMNGDTHGNIWGWMPVAAGQVDARANYIIVAPGVTEAIRIHMGATSVTIETSGEHCEEVTARMPDGSLDDGWFHDLVEPAMAAKSARRPPVVERVSVSHAVPSTPPPIAGLPRLPAKRRGLSPDIM